MSTPKILPAILAALFALAAGPALADIARPNPLRSPAEPTAQAHLEAAQRALQHTLDHTLLVLRSTSMRGGNLAISLGGAGAGARETVARGGASNDATTIAFGGYLARAAEDLTPAFAATVEALAFVRAHPETNPLAAGPVPADEPGSPTLPQLPARLTGSLNGLNVLREATLSLAFALAVLDNDRARDYAGPILGDLGGHRAKLIAAIARVGADLGNAIAYQQNTNGGDTGVIPLTASATVMPDPKFGPTARTYLTEARRLLGVLASQLANSARDYNGDKTQGGYAPKVEEGLQHASSGLTAALAWLDAHPEAAALLVGPARPEPSAARPVAIPPAHARL